MKLMIQIPCFNEERTLPETLADLPRRLWERLVAAVHGVQEAVPDPDYELGLAAALRASTKAAAGSGISPRRRGAVGSAISTTCR